MSTTFYRVLIFSLFLLSLLACHDKKVPHCADQATLKLIRHTAAKQLSSKEIIVNPKTIKIDNIQTMSKQKHGFACSADLTIYQTTRFPITYNTKLVKKKSELYIEINGLP